MNNIYFVIDLSLANNEIAMSFWKSLLNVVGAVGEAVANASVEIHSDGCMVELKPLGLMGVSALMKSRNDSITELEFGTNSIIITVEKFLLSHTIEITAAQITVFDDQVHVVVQLEEGLPFFARGFGGTIVASIINLFLGIRGTPGHVNVRGNIVSYHLPTEDMGLISRFTVQSGIQNLHLEIKPYNYSVFIQYPENMQINPQISSFLHSSFSNYKRISDGGTS